MTSLRSSAEFWEMAMAHARGAPERVMFAAASDEGAGELELTEAFLVSDDDLEPGPWCVQLEDVTQQRVLQWASGTAGAIVEMHSHLGRFGDPAQMSPTDVQGLRTWVPHVRWRLRGRPYVALVAGPSTLDGLVWSGDNAAAPLALAGWSTPSATHPVTGLSIASWKEAADG
jgi:hypothetical protein